MDQPLNQPLYDPADDPARERGRPARREFWLGLLLVLGVVVAAAGDWWHQEDQARGYAAGAAAADGRQWDTAAVTFGGLGAYRNAPDRARAAATQVVRRDAAYAAAQAAAARADWLGATRALSTTLAIEPGYRDAAPRLIAATTALTTAALSGVIIRQAIGDPPGLYVRMPGEAAPLWLPKSDRNSLVVESDPAAGRIVYETTDPRYQNTNGFPHLWIAELAGGTVQTTEIEGLTASNKGVVLGRAGFWWYNAADGFHFPVFISGYLNSTLGYQNWGSGTPQPVTLPDRNWGVLDIDRAGGRLLLGQFGGLDGTSVPYTRLYLAGPTGADPQPLALAAGLIHTAQFSPDGRFVLYTNYETRDRGQVVQRAALVAPDLAVSPAREQTVGSVTVAYGSEAVPVAGIFLPGPPGTRLLVKLSNGLSASFSVRDLVTGQQLRLSEGPTPPGTRYWLLPDGSALLTPAGDPAHPIYRLQPLDLLQPRPPLTLPTLPGGGQWPVQVLTVQGAAAVYTVDLPGTPDGRRWQAVVSAPIGADGGSVLLTREQATAQTGAPGHLLLPGGLLAYVAPDATLHLQALDAAVDLLALPGVDAIWPFGVPTTSAWQP